MNDSPSFSSCSNFAWGVFLWIFACFVSLYTLVSYFLDNSTSPLIYHSVCFTSKVSRRGSLVVWALLCSTGSNPLAAFFLENISYHSDWGLPEIHRTSFHFPRFCSLSCPPCSSLSCARISAFRMELLFLLQFIAICHQEGGDQGFGILWQDHSCGYLLYQPCSRSPF